MPSGMLSADTFDGIDILGYVNRFYRVQKDTGLQQEYLKNSYIEVAYSLLVEVLSVADLITDILVVESLIAQRQSVEISAMLLLMACPYLVSHSILCSLVQSRRQELARIRDTSALPSYSYQLLNAVSFILMTPFTITWLVLVDMIYMFYVIYLPSLRLSPALKSTSRRLWTTICSSSGLE